MSDPGFTLFLVNGKTADYFINGPDCQVLTVNLQPQQILRAEPGTMMHMSTNIDTDADCQPCNCGRICSGESCVIVEFTPKDGPGYVGLTPNFPAKVIPVDLSQMGHITTRQSAFMAGIGQIDMNYDIDYNCLRCCCGGMGCVRQQLSGTGTTFLAAGGTILQKNLAPGETILVDASCLLGWQDTVEFGLQSAGCAMMCCGGEGMFYAKMTGPGLVFLESMSFAKYKKAVAPDSQGNNNSDSANDS